MILLLTALLAVETIDLDMTPQDKKSTGVFKLRDKEKATLQQWIESRYEKRAQPLAQKPPILAKPMITENFYSGKYIRLSDGSLWNIRPQDTPITQGWITSVEIIIEPSQDPDYPNKLTNTLTGSSVLAKKVTELPQNVK
jgi:hypothetical protein